jgi:DNA-binding FadR family transcriptional regulator
MHAMGLAPVERRSLSQGVFDRLRTAILDGVILAGSALPAERVLCGHLGVNRQAVREALKRLEQLRLVAIRQGEATKVLDFRRTGGLELLGSMLFDAEGGLSLPVARGFVEMRAALGPDIARLAAERRGDDVPAALDAVVHAMRALAPDDAVGLHRSSLEYWRLLVTASDNIAYLLAFNTMERVWGRLQDELAPTLLVEVSDTDAYAAIAEAVRRRQPEAARRRAEALVDKGARARVAALLSPRAPARRAKKRAR